MTDIIQVENKYYISVNSTYADDRTRVLNHIDTFGIFDRWGDIKQMGEEVEGIYYNGMRFVSELKLRINDQRPLLLSSSVKEQNEILSVDLTNPVMENNGNNGVIHKGMLYIGRSKFVKNGACYEQIRLNNYSHEACNFDLSIDISADFKDIFEVRGIKREKRGEVYAITHEADNVILICYRGLDNVERFTEVQFSRKPDSWEQHNKAIFNVKLEAQEQMVLEYAFYFRIGDEKKNVSTYSEAKIQMENEIEVSNLLLPSITTSNQQFTQWVARSQYDLLSLLSSTEYGLYPYAGVPWYNTAFGRDGIITALQTLWLAPTIARDVLKFLANTQATEVNPYQDAEPGKIIHEIRGGEMVALNEVPFRRYYGSVDATPLFIVLAGEYYARTGDIDTVKEIWPNIEAALNWIDKYGDTDGDGFTDYQHKSVNGLVNQGWKDSHDSISYEDGELATPAIALCEVQGYVYDAKKQAAGLAIAMGNNELASKLVLDADELKRKFNERFWDEKLQCYVLALDGNGKACRVVSSNAGHCLFSNIADSDKAKIVAERLMQKDMYTGWGVRTLSCEEKRYNPLSYHNGSVWPHDVSLIAMGFANYGLQQHTLKLTDGLFDASLYIELQRLPELFCGFDRRKGEGPTSYPVACSPQAWSVAAVYMLLKACLNIEINALEKKVYLKKPMLPETLNSIDIKNLQLGDQQAHIEVFCMNGSVGVKVISCPEGWQILLITK